MSGSGRRLDVGDVVLGRNERGGERRRRLEHEADDEHHANASYDVRVVLDHELVAQVRHRLATPWSLSSYPCAHFCPIFDYYLLLNLLIFITNIISLIFIRNKI